MTTHALPDEPVDITKLFQEGTAIDAALDRAVRAALIRHKKLGERVVIERDGKVVWIPPEEIEDDGSIRPPAAAAATRNR